MIRNGKKREWVRRLMAIFLCLLLVMPSAPFSIGGIYTAKADEKRCPECEEYKDAVFCEKCGKCEDCVEICDHCGEICLNCHEEEFEAEGTTEAEPCGDCMRCKVGVDYCGYCGRCEECVELCDRCDEHICMECHAELAEDAVDEYCPCPDCGRCKGDGTPYCLECGICEDCAEICPYCEMCENCWEQDHCEFCNACMEYAGWCLDGGTHCIDCCELCDGCGYCFLTEEREKCDICGYCMDCCEDQGCPECGLCVEDDTYQDHLCGECGACLIENEVCEVCGLCRECCLDQLLQLGYTGDDRCYLEISDEDFCADCGICFLDGEICETCLEVGEYRCKECCALLSYEKGCDCESPVCVNSEEFAIHMENEHSEYVDAHQATPKNTWNMDLNSHWHDCRYCNEESHRFDLASHRFDENGRCTVCGYLSTDKIIIARQPYDAEVTATYNGWCENSSLPPECPGDRLATFSVIAYGKNGVKGLDYQWHQVIDYGSTTKDITLEENTNPYTDYVTGAKLPVLRVGIGVDVCYRNFWYYCVITDDEGNEVRTRNAQMNAVHRYEVFDPNTCQRTREGHRLHCVCKQCVGVSDLKPHTFGNWEWQTDESGAQTGKVRTCSVCGFEETVAVHEHNYDYSLLYDVNNEDVNVIKENDRTNEYEYEFTYNGKTIRMRIDRVGHSVDCSVPGCTFRQKEKHNWGHYQIINNAAETHHGTVYRTCKDCGMDETWLRTYYDWHTHPVNVSNGDADVDFAEEDTIVCVEPKFVDGKRVIGGVARINYKSTAGPSVRNNQATISLTEVDPGKLYNFRVPASGENGTRTVNGRVYTCYDEYGAEQIEVTFEYADCTHQETILTGQEEADCTRDGYTGDEICNYCGHIVTKGSYLAPNGHGEKVLATENIYETDRWGNIQVDKRGNNKYIVHAPETVYCDEENSRGCYTGDYICQDCGVVLEYGKYTSKQHNFIPFEELSEYHQNKYGNLLHLRSYQAPVGDEGTESDISIEEKSDAEDTFILTRNSGAYVQLTCYAFDVYPDADEPVFIEEQDYYFNEQSFDLDSYILYCPKYEERDIYVDDSNGETGEMDFPEILLVYYDEDEEICEIPKEFYTLKYQKVTGWKGDDPICEELSPGDKMGLDPQEEGYNGTAEYRIIAVPSEGSPLRRGEDDPDLWFYFYSKWSMASAYEDFYEWQYFVPTGEAGGYFRLPAGTKLTTVASDCNEKELTTGKEFSVSYVNKKTGQEQTSFPTKIGDYEIVLRGIAPYYGERISEYTLQIVPKGTSIAKLKKGKKSFTVKWKKQKSQTRGYEIQYSLKKNFKGKKTVKIKKNKITSKKIGKLKKKKTYYVRVRTFGKANGKTYYSAWSKVKKVKTK